MVLYGTLRSSGGSLRRELRIEQRHDDDVEHVEAGQHDAGEERAGVKLHHRHAGGRAIEDEHHARRNQDAETAARAHHAGRDLHVVARAQHRGKRQQAHQRHARRRRCRSRSRRSRRWRASRARASPDRAGGKLQRAEQPVENVGALDDVAHEDEQRDRDQHVVRHHRIGALDEQIEHQIAHRVVAEEHAERHQRERDRESEHDEDDEQREHQHAELGIAEAEHQIAPLRCPISSSSLTDRVFAVLGLLEHDLVEFFDVMQALRPLAGLDALDAADDLDDALHHHEYADDRDQRLELIDRRPERAGRGMLVHHATTAWRSRSRRRRRPACRERRTGCRAPDPTWPACAAASAVEKVAAHMGVARQRVGAGQHEQRAVEHVGWRRTPTRSAPRNR